jgi:anaerobic magnesium-protoporphyrin IX monomethyl ester cyclase
MNTKYPFIYPKKRSRLLLVYPPITKMERYGSNLGIFGGKQIPLGLYYLAAYVRENGFVVQALDAESLNINSELIVQRLRENRFNILGISVTTVAFHRGLALARFVKNLLPETIIIMGGPHVSCMPSHPLKFNAIDFAVAHEGEQTLVELLRLLEDGSDPKSIKGLGFRHNGKIVVNPKREYIRNLDFLPFPAYDQIPDIQMYTPPPFNYQKRPVANMITSRGCPNDCTFCENSTFGRKVRMRSAANIVDEIELLMDRYGIREIAFVDDTFTLNRRRILEIFELARKRRLDFPWTCMSRINTVDENLLRYMRDNGCWYIAFGIESGNPKILKEIRKKIDLADVQRTIDICHRLGIKTKGFFMVGHPKETVESIDQTIDFATRLKLDHIVVTVNTPMPGSYQYQHASEYGSLDDATWSAFNYWCPVFVPFGLSQEIILEKHREFLKRFYLRPVIIRRGLARSLKNPSDTLRQYFNMALDLMKYYAS